MDPLARLQIAGDTTFALMLAAQARDHEIWFCEPRHLSLEHADAVARAWPVTVRRVVGDHYLLGPQATVPLRAAGGLHAQGPAVRPRLLLRDVDARARARPDADHQRPARPARAEREARRARVPRPLPADDRHARGEAAALVPGRAGRRDGGQAARRLGRLRRVPRAPRRPQHRRDPRAVDQPRPPLDDGAEVPARGAARRQAHPARRRRAALRGAARARRPTTRAATCTSAPSRWRPRSTSATEDRRARSARGCASAATSSSAST